MTKSSTTLTDLKDSKSAMIGNERMDLYDLMEKVKF